ncbi:MAG: hypothetical protein JSW64_08910 [Candidatus Zixiibacteriota bacterium]|nr:MAG: hypothetical protein JSW64_08910 [candidate division Zixibacteria bacterium]
MDNEVQIKDINNQDKNGVLEETEEKLSEKTKSDEYQKVTKERIKRFKKAFKPTWLIRQLDSQDDKKGK